MKIRIPNVIRWYPVLSLTLAVAVISPCVMLYKYFDVDDHILAGLIGVHHLGEDYRISEFYVNKYIGDSVGEGGGGGSQVCCVSIPKIWTPRLKVDVRWEVYHIIRPSDPALQEKAEVVGIYKAQVPVEQYDKPGDFYIHFFPNGRVRIVVSAITSEWAQHPIQSGDTQANLKATTGSVIKSLFTAEEIAELERRIARDRKRYGDWR